MFFPLWIIASFVGVFIGSAAMYVLNLDFYPFVIMGFIIGLGQWVLLRKRILYSGWWILISSIGLAIAGIWGSNRELVNGSYVGIIYGILAGVGQWLILRKQVTNAELWIVISILGWGAAWGIGWWSTWHYYGIYTLIFSLITGIVAGVSTGLMLVWLLNRRQRQ